jgi:DNA adenine methylase
MNKTLLQLSLPLSDKTQNTSEADTALASGSIPHPIPYQGSKRKLASRILSILKFGTFENFYEPFAGSAAISIAAAQRNFAQKYFINDSLKALSDLLGLIVLNPTDLSERYAEIWEGHVGDSLEHFYSVRTDFNLDGDPAKLLYLLARCVKNAVRFNDKGEFNQSVDKRRLGTKPDRMSKEIFGAHNLLKGRTHITNKDYSSLLCEATSRDIVYMDPPYQGTSGKKDTRYHQSLDKDRLIGELIKLNSKSVPYLLSFDGRLGDKSYGEILPSELNLHRLEIDAGRSSQATLAGRNEQTIESLYVSEPIVVKLEALGLAKLLAK